jgi:hypothetical protein
VIKRLPDGMYAVSHRFFVYEIKFARRFKTKKQAYAYMTSSGFSKSSHAVEELTGETGFVAKNSNYYEKE